MPGTEDSSDENAGEAGEPNVSEEAAEEAPEGGGTTRDTMPPPAFAFDSTGNPVADEGR